jgi:hypothetical protein
VLQPAGDLGLGQEPGAAGRVVGVAVEDLLQRHLAVQLGVKCHEHHAQTATGVGAQHAEPLAVAGGRADDVGHCMVDVGIAVGVRPAADVGERGLDDGAAGSCQALAGRAVQVEGREALLGVAAVEPEVRVDQGVEQGTVLGAQRALVGEPLGQRPALRARPGAEGEHELVARDHPVLERQQAEQKIAWGVVASWHREGSRPPAAGVAT